MPLITSKPTAQQLVTLLSTIDMERDRLTAMVERNKSEKSYHTADYFAMMVDDLNKLYEMFVGSVTVEITKHVW